MALPEAETLPDALRVTVSEADAEDEPDADAVALVVTLPDSLFVTEVVGEKLIVRVTVGVKEDDKSAVRDSEIDGVLVGVTVTVVVAEYVAEDDALADELAVALVV